MVGIFNGESYSNMENIFIIILYMKLFIFFIITLSMLFIISLYNLRESFTSDKDFLQKQELYYSQREQGSDDVNDLPLNNDAKQFYKFDASKPLGQQLEIVEPTIQKPNDVDINVKKCNGIKSCSELDGTKCGYCFSNNRFYYGDKNGPLTDVCEGKWVTTTNDCVEHRERSVCDAITKCHDMVGDAAICAWCPTKNKAFVYKEENGIISPKYDSDVCDDTDITIGKNLGLVKQSDCSTFTKDHPCIGPNENSGPHSTQCLNYLWSKSGCTPNGTESPSKNTKQLSIWNASSWVDVLANMKSWFTNANSSNWDNAKKYYPGCYGSTPKPCDSKYGSPVECYQEKFTESGCTEKGTEYPKVKPSMDITQYTTYIQQIKDNAHDENIDFDKRNDAYNKCYGGKLQAPPQIKLGDLVKYVFDSKKFGKNTLIQGYVCSLNQTNKTAKMYWELVQNESGSTTATRKWHLNNQTLIKQFWGEYCGSIPELIPELQSSIPQQDLQIVSAACSNNTDIINLIPSGPK